MIQGVTTVPEQDVKDKIAAQTQNQFQSNIFLFNSQKLQNELLYSYPFFTQIQVFKGLPHTLQVKVVERRAILVWIAGDQKYFIDDNGIVFQFNDKNNSPDFPIIEDDRDSQIKIGDKIVTKDFIGFAQKINTDFTAKSQLKINKISVKDNLFDVNITTDNFMVIFSTLRNVDDQLADLATVIPTVQNQAKEYIDLRIEGKVYYK
jgi:cell division septal protein FtsQ